MNPVAMVADSGGAVAGVIAFIVLFIVGAVLYQNWLQKGLRERVVETRLTADQVRTIFAAKVGGMGWKVVDHDNPMVAQSPLLAGRRQQISLTLARTGSGLRCSIKPTRVWVKGLARVPYKAHTIRMRLNAFERAVLAAGGGPVSSISGASAAQHNPLPRPVPSPSPPTPSAPTGPSVGLTPPAPPPGPAAVPTALPPVALAAPAAPAPAVRHPEDDHDGHTMSRSEWISRARPDDHDGHTVVRSRGGVTVPPTPPPPAWTIHLDTGEMHRLDRPTLLGRSPIPKPGEAHLQQVVVTDPSLTVSKTHLLVEVTADGLVVTDRGSANGTMVQAPPAAPQPLAPNVAVAVAPGAVVHFGDRSFTVRPT